MGRLLLLALLLTGCITTPYQPFGVRGGHLTERLSDSRWRVGFRGNANTSYAMVKDYALLRAAEVTLQLGGAYFTVEARRDAPWSPGGSVVFLSGNQRPEGFGGAAVATADLPGVDLDLTVYEAPPRGRHIEWYDARQVVDELAAHYRVPLSTSPQR